MVSVRFEMPNEEEMELRRRLLRDPEFAKAFQEARAVDKPVGAPKRAPRILPDLTQQVPRETGENT